MGDYGKKKPCGKWKEWKGPDARRHSRHNLNLHPKFQCANFLGFYSFYLRLSNSERVRSVLSIASLISFVKILLHMYAAYISHSVHVTFCTSHILYMYLLRTGRPPFLILLSFSTSIYQKYFENFLDHG